MNTGSCDFAVIGGDMRQVYAARMLKERGYRVCCALLCGDEGLPEQELREAVCSARVVLAPVPLSVDRLYLNQKSGEGAFPLTELFDCLKEGQKFYAGCISEEFAYAVSDKGAEAIDIMKQEEIAVYNTIATAEGAVAEAVMKSPRNLHGSRCLVLGYGKCARTLTALLKGMHCQVQVCARNPAQLAEAAILADKAFEFGELEAALPDYDFIFNTVPAMILNRRMIEDMNSAVCIFDIASAPGGVEFEAAEELGISAWLLPGLPGKYAPASSAEAIVRYLIGK